MSAALIYITGASAGIGAEVAKRYAAPGVCLCLLTKADQASFSEVMAECERRGADVVKFVADVADRQQMESVARQIIARYGIPDLVIANAGIAPQDPQDYATSFIAEEAMAVNFHGVVYTFASFIAPMQARGRGHLVALSSVSALRATPNSGFYAASKAAVSTWTEGLRLRLAAHGITVTTICPGFVRTSMTSVNTFYMPGIISAERAADYIHTAIRRKKSRVYFPILASLIWKTFHFLPDSVYDLVITMARRYWPDSANKS